MLSHFTFFSIFFPSFPCPSSCGACERCNKQNVSVGRNETKLRFLSKQEADFFQQSIDDTCYIQSHTSKKDKLQTT